MSQVHQIDYYKDGFNRVPYCKVCGAETVIELCEPCEIKLEKDEKKVDKEKQ